MAIKRERETFNKSNLSMYPFYPSEKRKTILETGLQKLRGLLDPLKQQNRELQNQVNQSNYQLGTFESNNRSLSSKVNNTKNMIECPTCHQTVTNEYKNAVEIEVQELINRNLDEIAKIEQKIINKNLDIEVNGQYIEQLEQKIWKIQKKFEQLKARLQQKAYIWTDKDVLIIKKSISELDNFYSFYLTETIKSLEPVINHILRKVNFAIHFNLNEKNQFDFSIYSDNVEYKYPELSMGQKLMVSMAVKMALLLERGESGLIISDEGMSSLSETNLALMFELIKEFPFQLLAVVHRYENPASFLNVFELNKGIITHV